jgi:hypothetical protein
VVAKQNSEGQSLNKIFRFLQDVKSDLSINRTLFCGLLVQKLQIHPTVRGGIACNGCTGKVCANGKDRAYG